MTSKERLAALVETLIDRLDMAEERDVRIIGGMTEVQDTLKLDGEEISLIHRKVDGLIKTVDRFEKTLETVELLLKRHTQSTSPPEQDRPTKPEQLETTYKHGGQIEKIKL